MSEQQKPPDEWSITNSHAGASVAGAIYSPSDENMLVALVLVENTLQMLEAFRMSMTVKGGTALKMTNTTAPIYHPDRQVNLTTAGKGYKCNTVSLAKVDAIGNARAYVHPAADDPRTSATEYFYVVAENDPNIDTLKRFGERLNLGIPHAILPDWNAYLLNAGTEAKLVESLPVIGDEWKWAVRVDKDPLKWQDVIAAGLREGAISIG
jgi:hypothetical protein